MNSTQSFFIEVLKNYINDCNDAPNPKGIDFKSFINLCHIHNVSGIAYYTLKKEGISFPDKEKDSLEKDYLAEIVFSYRQEEVFKELSNILNENNIQYATYKGIIIKNLYPNPELRTMGDIDILLHCDDRKKINDILLKLGYIKLADKDEWLYNKNQVNIEIHSKIKYAYKSKINIPEDDFWNHIKQTGASFAYELDPVYHLALLIDHMAMHTINRGLGIRMLLDIAVWLKFYLNRIDIDSLTNELINLNILQFSKRVFFLCEQLFSIKSPYLDFSISKDTYDNLVDFILSGGVFGKNNSSFNNVDYLLAKNSINSSANSKFKNKFSVFLPLLFPPFSTMKRRYPYLSKIPLLLPIAWVQRCFSKVLRPSYNDKESIKRFTYEKQTEILKSILNDFGL